VKGQVIDLALFGGTAEFGETLHVGRPNIGDRDRLMMRIEDILDRRWLTNNGPYVEELEARIAQWVDVRHCVCLSNATLGLEIAARAAGLTGEIIVPSFTFIATAHALQWIGLQPVFCDIDPRTHNIDPAEVERHISERTTGILAVHVWGRPCDTEVLEEIAHRHKLRLIFDAAHAFSCSSNGRMIGGFGDCEVLSFHATKFFNTFEGGAIVTNDDELAKTTRLMRNFGFAGYDTVLTEGTNGKMNEVCAAMGLTGLESLDQFVAVNYDNYRTYQHELRNIAGLQLVSYDERESCNYQYIVVEVDETLAGIDRNQLVAILRAENVMARRYFYPGCHSMEPYRTLCPQASMWLPHTEGLTERVISLPNGTAVGPTEVRRVCQIIRFVVANAREIGNMALRKAASV